MNTILEMTYPCWKAGMVNKRAMPTISRPALGTESPLNKPDVVVGPPATLIKDDNVQIEISFTNFIS